MIFRPAQLGMAKLDRLELEADKKACRKIGPCGVGKKALYLNSFYIDRRYYLPYGSISRVFKRVAMSSGGFTGKGMFASMAYLVVEYDGGKQKQCNFKDERDVDKLLEVLAKEQPQIPLLSEAGEQALQKKEAEKAARKLPELTDEAKHSVTVLRKAKEYLEEKPELAEELSAAERRKRAQLQSKPVYRYVALAIFVFGIVSAAYGLYAVTNHVGNYGIYFALFGFAAIFLFSSYNMLPTARNNNNAIMKRADKAEAAMAEYVKHYPNGAFPVPSCYAHPIVLKQMTDAIEEGRAVTVPEALDAVEARLKSLNADVQVEQEEYDEVVVIKAMFLNHDYQCRHGSSAEGFARLPCDKMKRRNHDDITGTEKDRSVGKTVAAGEAVRTEPEGAEIFCGGKALLFLYHRRSHRLDRHHYI